MSQGSGFVWYELMTSDLSGARRFYAEVIGWTIEDANMQGMTYLLAKVDGAMVAGLMATPAEATGAPPAWLGYVGVDDVDATAGRVSDAGGMIHHPPSEIPGVGRFAVVADPQGAAFALFAADGPRPADTPAAPGHLGWRELHARDWGAAFAFYEALFGWRKAEAMDMGPMGTYQLFSADGGDAVGGMMTSPEVPMPFWLYYITVGEFDAALARIAEAGGTVVQGPMEVPGGAWIAQARDPQGAFFAITGRRG
jgi:predicted enzyme related to lactoylglutathione lyase